MLLLRTSRGVDPGIPLLRSLGSNAHVWLPGANGVNVASLASENYLLSAGSTGYSTVDGVDGLTLDGMGSLGSELNTVPFASWTFTGGYATSGAGIQNTGAAGYAQLPVAIPAGTYVVTYTCDGVGGVNVCTAGFAEGTAGSSVIGIRTAILIVASARASIGFQNGAGPVITSVSIKPYTGTHLTQATTANKPLVRRGAYNIATYSDSIAGGTGAWILNAGSTQTANNALSPSGTLTATRIVTGGTGANEGIYLSALSTVGRVEVFSLWLKGAVGGEQVMIGDASNRKTVTLTTSWARYSDNGAARVSNRSVIYAVSNTAMTFYASQAQLEAGTTAGDYTQTTTIAASNPSAGKYWWSFDGSNDSLLSGNLGFTNACTIVIAGLVNSLAAINYLLGEDTNGVQLYINTNGSLSFGKVTIADILVSSAGQIVAGVPFVLTVRLSGGTAVFRLNGAQIATGATAYTFSATTGARIGMTFASILPLNGAIGWVVPIAAALSDADCLTVERLVGQRFPGMATF